MIHLSCSYSFSLHSVSSQSLLKRQQTKLPLSLQKPKFKSSKTHKWKSRSTKKPLCNSARAHFHVLHKDLELLFPGIRYETRALINYLMQHPTVAKGPSFIRGLLHLLACSLSTWVFTDLCCVFCLFIKSKNVILEDKDLLFFWSAVLKTQNMCYSSAVVERNIWNSPFLSVRQHT